MPLVASARSLALLLALVIAPRLVSACDVCAVYTATELRETALGPRVSLAEQWSVQETVQRDGDEVPNPAGERLRSSITQVVAGWQLTPRFGAQVNLPIIARHYRRLEDGRVVSGDETGIGDVSVLGHLLAFSRVSEASVLRFTLIGGLKLPSGDTDRLAEELDEAPVAASVAARLRPRHAGGPTSPGDDEHGGTHDESAIHGHDLALGSGSADGIVGGQLFWSWHRVFATAWMQYAIRTEGDFDYRYADDMTFGGGPGYFVLLTHAWSLGLQASVAGETKGADEQRGRTLHDTAVTTVYVGPGLLFTWATSLGAEIAADLPVVRNNTGLQTVPDYRLRAGVTYRF